MVLMVLPQNIVFMLTVLLMYFYLCYSMLLFDKRHLPTDFMKTAIVPIIKNKTEPIALVSATSKLFEIYLLEFLQMYLITHDHQFGFKTKHSC